MQDYDVIRVSTPLRALKRWQAARHKCALISRSQQRLLFTMVAILCCKHGERDCNCIDVALKAEEAWSGQKRELW